MPRPPQGPRYRADRDTWIVQIDGKTHTLAHGEGNREEARRVFHRLMVERDAPAKAPNDPPIGLVIARYLADARARVSRDELDEASRKDLIRRISDFHVRWGDLPCSELRSRMVHEWLDSKDWGPTTRHDAVGAIKAALNWAEGQGIIPANPIRTMRKPSRNLRRELIVSPDRVPEVLALIRSPQFHDFASFLWMTGARPREAYTLEASWIDWENRRVVFPPKKHKTGRKTGKARVIHLPEKAAAILAANAEVNPTGPVFRNSRGRPWNKNSINCQIYYLRKRSKGEFGNEVTAYALRHVFATEALERTGDLAGVAAAMGHSGTNLLSTTYSHLDKRHLHIRALVDSIRPEAPVPSPLASLDLVPLTSPASTLESDEASDSTGDLDADAPPPPADTP